MANAQMKTSLASNLTDHIQWQTEMMWVCDSSIVAIVQVFSYLLNEAYRSGDEKN